MIAALALSALVAAAPAPAPRPGEPIRIEIRQNSFVADFTAPPDPARHPAVVVLGGFGGDVPTGAGLAHQGYAELALAYFGAAPLPSQVDQIPLETVTRALDWLAARPDVDPARIGILGVSKGAELALLVAARDPRIRTVAVISPTAYVWFGTVFDSGPNRSSWTSGNAPLPFIETDRRAAAALAQAFESGGTFAYRDLFDASLAAASAPVVAAATIPVERIAGPLLCIAGDDDRAWDSAGACKTIAARRHAARRDGADQVAIEPGAGHTLSFGGRALPDVIPAAAGRMKFRLGGSVEANNRGAADAWTRTLTFFARTL